MPQLPALQLEPRNALLDLTPVNNALMGIQKQQNDNRNYEMDQQRLGMEQKRFEQQSKSANLDYEAKLVSRSAGLAQMAMAEKNPQRKAAMIERMYSLAPNYRDNLTAHGINPDDHDGVANFIIAQARGYQDPMDVEAKRLDLDYKRAQIAKTNRDAAESGSSYGKNGAVVQGPDGSYYAVRYGADGTERINKLEVGGQNVSPARGVDVVGNTMYDKSTGKTVGDVSQALSGAETAKVQGKAIGEGALALPKARVALEQYNEQEKVVQDSIDKAISQSNGWTTGLFGSASSFVPGTPAHNLSNTLNTIKSNLGFDKLQAMRDASPTGGALGQVSEMENRLLQSVWGSVEQSQTKEQLVENMQQIKNIRARFAALKQQAYEEDVKRFGAANVPNPEMGAMPKTNAPDPLGIR